MPRGYPVINQEPLDRLVDLLFSMQPYEIRAAVALVKGFSRNRPVSKDQPEVPDKDRQQSLDQSLQRSLEGVKDATG